MDDFNEDINIEERALRVFLAWVEGEGEGPHGDYVSLPYPQGAQTRSNFLVLDFEGRSFQSLNERLSEVWKDVKSAGGMKNRRYDAMKLWGLESVTLKDLGFKGNGKRGKYYLLPDGWTADSTPSEIVTAVREGIKNGSITKPVKSAPAKKRAREQDLVPPADADVQMLAEFQHSAAGQSVLTLLLTTWQDQGRKINRIMQHLGLTDEDQVSQLLQFPMAMDIDAGGGAAEDDDAPFSPGAPASPGLSSSPSSSFHFRSGNKRQKPEFNLLSGNGESASHSQHDAENSLMSFERMHNNYSQNGFGDLSLGFSQMAADFDISPLEEVNKLNAKHGANDDDDDDEYYDEKNT